MSTRHREMTSGVQFPPLPFVKTPRREDGFRLLFTRFNLLPVPTRRTRRVPDHFRIYCKRPLSNETGFSSIESPEVRRLWRSSGGGVVVTSSGHRDRGTPRSGVSTVGPLPGLRSPDSPSSTRRHLGSTLGGLCAPSAVGVFDTGLGDSRLWTFLSL